MAFTDRHMLIKYIKTYFKLIFAHMSPNYFHLIYLYGSPRNAVFNLFRGYSFKPFYCSKSNLFLFFTIFLLLAFRILFSNNLNWFYIIILIPYGEQIYKNLQIINNLKKRQAIFKSNMTLNIKWSCGLKNEMWLIEIKPSCEFLSVANPNLNLNCLPFLEYVHLSFYLEHIYFTN